MDSAHVKPPRTIMEAFQSLPEGTLAQVINNQIYMSPSPSDSHQGISIIISALLFNYVEKHKLGQVRTAPFDVFLNRKNAFQPDIIFVASENLYKIKETGFYGAPDLVIEILSPASWRFDKEDKKDEYERSGVKEYWLVDPKEKIAEGFYLVDNEFQPLDTLKGSISFKLFALTIQF